MTFLKVLYVSLILSIVFLIAGCPKGKVKVTKVPQSVGATSTSGSLALAKSRKKLNGVFYSLPRTVVRVGVPMKLTQITKGKFSLLTPFFFPTGTSYRKFDSFNYNTGDSTLEITSEPDPDEVYLVDIRSRFFETKTLFLDFSEQGILTQAKAESKDETFNVIAKAASEIGSRLVDRTSGLRSLRTPAPATPTYAINSPSAITALTVSCNSLSDAEEAAFCDSITDSDLRNFFAGLDSKGRKFFRTLSGKKEKTWNCYYDRLMNFLATMDESEQAIKILDNKEEACLRDRINDPFFSQQKMYLLFSLDPRLRFVKSDFLNALQAFYDLQERIQKRATVVANLNESSLPPETLSALLKELDTTIKEHKNFYFLGVKDTEIFESKNIEFVPTGSSKELHLFNFSKKDGVCKDGFSAVMNFNKDILADCSGEDYIKVRLVLNESKLLATDNQIAQTIKNYAVSNSKERGFYYRVPGDYTASVIKEIPKKDAAGRLISLNNSVVRETEDILSVPSQIAQLGTVISLPASTGGWEMSYQIALNPNTGALKNFQLGTDGALQKSFVEQLTKFTTDTLDKTNEVTRLERRKKMLELIKAIEELESGDEP